MNGALKPTIASWTLKEVVLATKSVGKEQLGGSSGLQNFVLLSHCPEQQGIALFNK